MSHLSIQGPSQLTFFHKVTVGILNALETETQKQSLDQYGIIFSPLKNYLTRIWILVHSTYQSVASSIASTQSETVAIIPIFVEVALCLNLLVDEMHLRQKLFIATELYGLLWKGNVKIWFFIFSWADACIC